MMRLKLAALVCAATVSAAATATEVVTGGTEGKTGTDGWYYYEFPNK